MIVYMSYMMLYACYMGCIHGMIDDDTSSSVCKGKDRTSMGVTLENARSLVEDIGALQGEAIQMTCTCDLH